MKKSFWLAVPFGLVSLALAFTASAQTAVTTQGSSCYTFTRNAGVGTRLGTTEAAALQRVLASEGQWNTDTTIGTYDETVAAAVVHLQAKYGIIQTGYFGPLTRAKVNSLYGCGSTSPVPVTPVQPVTTIPVPVQCPVGYVCRPVTDSSTGGTPVLASLSPTTLSAGSYLTVYGSGFKSPNSLILVSGNGIGTINDSPNSVSSDGTTMSVIIPPTFSPGTYSVQVRNVDNGGSLTSANTLNFTVTSQPTPNTTCPAGYICNPATTPVNNNSAARSSIEQLYVTLQCREPDSQGWDYWTAYANSTDLNTIRQMMMGGVEYQTKQGIIRLYQQYFGRTPSCAVTNGTSELHQLYEKVYNVSTGVANYDAIRGSTPQNGGNPVINGASGPITLYTGQTGTWSVSASDPKNGTLSYSVDWGDSSSCPAGYTCVAGGGAKSFSQTSTFSHSYSTPGTYTVTVTVQNSYGGSAQTSSTVSVRNSAPSSAVTLSLDASSPVAQTIQVTDRVNGQYLGLPVLVFDLKSAGGQFLLRSATVNFSIPGNIAAAYLYQGSTQIASTAVTNGVATFSNINQYTNGATIPANATIPYTVKVDVSGVNTGAISFAASVSSASVLDQYGVTTFASGSAAGGQITVSAAPQQPQVVAPTITNTSASASPIASLVDGTKKANMTYSFTFNPGNTSLYVANSRTAVQIDATNGTGGLINSITASSGTIAGDTATAYYVPAGTSRTFTVTGVMDNTYGTAGSKTMSIIGINYGTSSSAPTALTITSGLSGLSAATRLDGSQPDQSL